MSKRLAGRPSVLGAPKGSPRRCVPFNSYISTWSRGNYSVGPGKLRFRRALGRHEHVGPEHTICRETRYMHLQESSEKLISSSDAGFSGLLLLQKLEHLTLELRLLSFPSAICHLPSLRSLTLRGAVRLRIPSDITYLTSLTFLDVSSCGMRGVPRAICGLYSALPLSPHLPSPSVPA